ncbi:MAG: hypothetical protein QW620_01825 [Thermoplasmata archaeon]
MRGSAALLVVMLLLSGLPLATDVIGGKEDKGTNAGLSGSEIAIDGDFRDWAKEDCKGLGGAYDSYQLNDGYDNSRDLLAFYYREGKNAIYLRVDLLDLALGAETGNLDIYFLLNFTSNQTQQWLPDFTECSTDTPWSVAICIYDTTHFAVYTADWGTTYNHSIEAIAYHSRWDSVEVRINKDVLHACGWTDGKEINFQVFTTKDGTDGGAGEIPGKPDIIDSIPVCFPWDIGYLKGALTSNSTTGTAKVLFLHHGNQFIKNIADFVRDGNGNGFWNVPEIHEKWNLPVNLHVSGTMAEAAQWFRPDFNAYLRSLAEKGIVRMVGGYYTEYIPQYIPPEVNAWSLNYSREYNLLYYNNCIPVAWVPERVYWKNFDAQILDAGYQAVIVDTEDGFKWYAEPSGYTKETKVYKTPAGLKLLFISNRGNNTFDKYNIQEQLFRLTDNGLSINMREKFSQLARDADQEQYYLYMDDWEKVCGNIPDWGGPEVIYAYDSNIGWIAQHQWIECLGLDELLAKNWQPAGTLNIGDCTYFWLSRNMGTLGRSDVAPHDTYNLYDAWYYDPLHECTTPSYYNYIPTDTNTKLGDRKTNTTLIGKTWELIKQIPEQSPLFELARKTFSNMLYETAWRDLPGGVSSQISYWQKEQAAHIRTAAIYYYADEWLNARWNGTRAMDVDLDGNDEYLLANQYVFCVFEKRGGKLVFAINSNGTQLVGNQPTGYLDERDAYTDIISSTTSNTHYYPGAKYLEGSKTYPFEDMGTENEFYDVILANSTLAFTHGTLTKKFELKNNVLNASYSSAAKTRVAFSPDLKNMLRNGTAKLSELVNTTENSFGYANQDTALKLIMRNASICGAGTVAHAKYVEVEGNGNFTLSLVFGKETLKENLAPVLLSQIPDVSISEDTKKDTLIDLRKYFEDVDSINYTVEKGDNGSFVEAYIYEEHYLGVDARKTENWYGNVKLRIIARDTLNQTTYSNWFVVEVMEVNDPPVIALTTDLSEKLSGVLVVEGSVSDVDGNVVSLQYRMDTGDWVNITPGNNWSATIDLAQVSPGKHTLTLRAIDDRGLTTEKKFVIEVEKSWTKEITAAGFVILTVIVIASLEAFLYWRDKPKKGGEKKY